MPQDDVRKKIYDDILKEEPQQANEQKVTFKQKLQSFFAALPQKCMKFLLLLKKNYVAFELVLFGVLLLLLLLMPAVHLFSNRFLETVNQGYSFYQVAMWMFDGKAVTSIGVLLSLSALLILLCGLGAIIFGVVQFFVTVKKGYLGTLIFHGITLLCALAFWNFFDMWHWWPNFVHLQALGFDTVYFNFYTIDASTYVFFIISFVLVAFGGLYFYHNRKQIFKNK